MVVAKTRFRKQRSAAVVVQKRAASGTGAARPAR
jgi:hypothetical protein